MPILYPIGQRIRRPPGRPYRRLFRGYRRGVRSRCV